MLALVVIGSACSPAGAAVRAREEAAPSPSAVVQQWTPNPNWSYSARSGMPDGAAPCRSQDAVEGVLREFAEAFNSGDPAKLENVLSEEFWAVSVAARYAYTRPDAITMLLERHSAGDRLEFRRVTVNGLSGWDGAAHIGPVELTLRRDETTSLLSGKGALYCAGRARGIKVIGLGA